MSVLFHRRRFYALLPMSCYAVTLPSRPCLLYCPAATVCCHNNCHFASPPSILCYCLSAPFSLCFFSALFPSYFPVALTSYLTFCPPSILTICSSVLVLPFSLSWFRSSPLPLTALMPISVPPPHIVLCTIGAAVKYRRVLCFRELHLNHNLLRLLPYELGKLFNLQVLGLKVSGTVLDRSRSGTGA